MPCPSHYSKVHRIDESEKDGFLGIRGTFYTRSLAVPDVDPERVLRLKSMLDLNDQGISTTELSDWSNATGLTPRRGASRIAKVIWVSIHK